MTAHIPRQFRTRATVGVGELGVLATPDQAGDAGGPTRCSAMISSALAVTGESLLPLRNFCGSTSASVVG